MKSQGLPITTIVLIVIILVTLIAVSIFFFSGFGKTSKQLSPSISIAKCQSICSNAKSMAANMDYSSSNEASIKEKSKFCENNCSEVVSCRVTWKNGVTTTLDCP